MDKENETIINTVTEVEISDNHDSQLYDLKVSILFYVIQCLLFLFTLYINILVHRMAQREKMVLSWELKLDSICNIVSSIYYLIFMAIAKFSSPPLVIFGEWYCKASEVIMAFDLFRTLTFTFTIGVYRYVFIVRGEWINIYESRKKLVKRTMFLIKMFFLVLFTAKFVIFNRNSPFIELWSHWCREGVPHTTPRNANSTISILSHEKHFYSVTPDGNAMVTLFGLIKNGGLSTSLKIFCIIIDILIFISILNVTEGVFHYRIGKFLKKYVYLFNSNQFEPVYLVAIA